MRNRPSPRTSRASTRETRGQLREDGRPQAGRHLDGGAIDRHSAEAPRTDRPEHAQPLPGLDARCRSLLSRSKRPKAACRSCHSPSPTAEVERHVGGADAQLQAEHRARGRRAGALDPARHPDPDRRARRPYGDDRTTHGWSSCSARPSAGARRCAHCFGRAHARRAAVQRRDRGRRCRSPAPTTSRSTPSSYLSALAGGEVPLEFLFSRLGLLRRAPAACCRPRPSRGTARPSIACR